MILMQTIPPAWASRRCGVDP
jgi:hypothetical protein